MSSSAAPPVGIAAATTALPGSAGAGEDEDLFLLGLEEHFATAELWARPGSLHGAYRGVVPGDGQGGLVGFEPVDCFNGGCSTATRR